MKQPDKNRLIKAKELVKRAEDIISQVEDHAFNAPTENVSKDMTVYDVVHQLWKHTRDLKIDLERTANLLKDL